MSEWSMLRDGLASLRQASARSFEVRRARIVAQCNPVRAKSSGAKIDAASLAARPCFLCERHLPADQRAVAFGSRWWVLCNPAPIFEPHFTVVSREHEPQRIAGALETLLDLARAFGGRYTVFYNGPLCGASAPDHLHLQASPASATPFEVELADQLCADRSRNGERWLEWVRREPVRVGVTRPSRWPAVLFIGQDAAATREAIVEVLDSLGRLHPAEPEPMVNLLTTFAEDRWLLWLYPRKLHRPSNYGSGPDEFLISPGAVDLAGLLITPRPSDFERLNAAVIERVYDDVLLAPGIFAQLREHLAR